MELENGPVKPIPPRANKLKIIGEAASLAVTTVILLGVCVTSYLAAIGAGNIFKNTTAQVYLWSDKYFTQVRHQTIFSVNKFKLTEPLHMQSCPQYSRKGPPLCSIVLQLKFKHDLPGLILSKCA